MASSAFKRVLHWLALPAIGVGAYSWLLAAQFLLFIVAPWLTGIEIYKIRLSDLICFFVLLAGIAAVSKSRVAVVTLGIFATCSIVSQFATYYNSALWLEITTNAASMLFLLGLFIVIAVDVFGNRREVTMHTIAGACVGYLLIGGIFAALYSIVLRLDPGSIALWPDATYQTTDIVFQKRGWGVLGYYSLVTLTTLGYGDIVPTSPITRSAAMIEAVIGQLYLAIIVARLVGMYRGRGSVGHSVSAATAE